MIIRNIRKTRRKGALAFTLTEVVISIMIAALAFGAIIMGYTQTTRRAEWTGYALSAQSLAIQQLEQARSAVWDPAISKNEITNLNLIGWTYNSSTRQGKGYSWAILDLPIQGTNVMRATNFVTIRQVYLNGSSNPPVQVHMVQVDTVWKFSASRTPRLFTNTVCTYLAPDNRDAGSL